MNKWNVERAWNWCQKSYFTNDIITDLLSDGFKSYTMHITYEMKIKLSQHFLTEMAGMQGQSFNIIWHITACIINELSRSCRPHNKIV